MLDCLINRYKICIAKKVPPLAKGHVDAKKYLEWEEWKGTTEGSETTPVVSVSFRQTPGNKGGIWLSPPKSSKEDMGVKNFCMRLKSCFLKKDYRGKNKKTVKGNKPNSCCKAFGGKYVLKNVLSDGLGRFEVV